MSSGMSSDQILKNEIINNVGSIQSFNLRIFPEGSDLDILPVEEGGLTYSFDGISYGSCDAAWFETVNGKENTVIALEGTDALNRGSGGNAQYQRFHHALGAVKNGYIGIYYLRVGYNLLQLDLYEMAYNATKNEKSGGYYLITQDLSVVSKILRLIKKYGRKSKETLSFLDDYIETMHKKWYENKFNLYEHDWNKFAKERSTALLDNCVVKCVGRMKRNFVDSSQRAGHIAVGEMYLTKYLFYGKKVMYLCPRMTKEDVIFLDNHKKNDKEWKILRNEKNVFFITRDNLDGLDKKAIRELSFLSDIPLKGQAMIKFTNIVKIILEGLRNGTIKLKDVVAYK